MIASTTVKPDQNFTMPISPSKRAYFPDEVTPESPSKGQARYRLGNLLSGIRTGDIIMDSHNEESTYLYNFLIKRIKIFQRASI